jgi:hypothetical protein
MDVIGIIKSVAPWLGTALGGPLGGMAISAICDALGCSEKTIDAVKTAVSGATPEQLLSLKTADQEFSVKMQELGFSNIEKMEELAVVDRKSARDMQIARPSFVPAALTWVLVSAFVAVMFSMIYKEAPAGNKDILVYMIGQLSGVFLASCTFWYGTTRQGERKTELLAQAPAIEGK